jgi:hypothetical protein
LLSKNRIHIEQNVHVESRLATAKPSKWSSPLLFSGTKLTIDLRSRNDNDDKNDSKINGEINDAQVKFRKSLQSSVKKLIFPLLLLKHIEVETCKTVT